MQQIQHILFPIDFSERCCSAVPFVETMARRYRAKITLLSALAPYYFSSISNPGTPIGAPMVNPELLVADLQSRLENTQFKSFAGLQVDRIAEIGDAAQAITEFAAANDVDLIMMPTHGYGPFRRMLLGSVTAKVLHDASCCVWTAAHTDQPPVREHIATSRVLCAINAMDVTDASLPMIRWAQRFAADAGATLRLVHVMHGEAGGYAHQLDREYESIQQKNAEPGIRRLMASAGIDAPISIDAGDTAAIIAEEARQRGDDLVVIGRSGKHAYDIVRQAPCPVISV